MFCTDVCKATARTEPRTAVRRWCPTCEQFFTTDMSNRQGAAPTYCSDRCSEKSKSLLRLRSHYTCALSGCHTPVDTARWFCTVAHRDAFVTAHPEWESCRHCHEPVPIPTEPRLPQKFCNNECREAYIGLDTLRASEAALREKHMTNRQRTNAFAQQGRKGKRSTKPHDYTMAIPHMEKLRWGTYPPRILVQILKLGWASEEEFFTTEDRWSPAIYEKIRGVPIDARTPVGAVIGVRDYGETEPRPLAADPEAPSDADYLKAANEIIKAYKREKKVPQYVTDYIRSTGHNPARR